ncbi:hypothetical protein [Singulisphaera sp. PoT]|uniref:hypothetical protein n=1 Tax=Singulisphaera sp. PoT TaxID=3411797 RepID=UPI003BF52970
MTYQLVLSIVMILSVGILVAIAMRRERVAFEVKFPPISDEEFLARCAPGTNPEIALKVRRIVSNSLGVDYERIHPECRFVDDLGAD